MSPIHDGGRVLPVYVVGACWMRSGTSGLMAALEAGGMEAVYRQSRDVMKNRYSDEHYDANVGGLYELERADYQKPDFPRGYEGKLIKALQMGVANMRMMPGGIKVVSPQRDPEEQRQSYMAFFGGQAPTVEQIALRVERSLEAARNRKDTEVLELQYADLVQNPRKYLAEIGDFFGVDLDIAASAAVIDPSLYRYKLAELEVGIV